MEVKISDSELEWLIRIHKQVRNQFVHFEPKSWSLEVSGIPEVSSLICRIIKDILQAGWGFRHLKNEMRAQLGEDLHELSKMDWGRVH